MYNSAYVKRSAGEHMDLYTIGYEGLTIREFINNLSKNNISIVADIRFNPISRKQGFSKRILCEELAKKGIGYIHFKELGTPKDVRDKFKQTNDEKIFSRKYKRILEAKQQLLFYLCELVKTSTVALMCFEKDPEKCHRTLLAEEIQIISGNCLTVFSI